MSFGQQLRKARSRKHKPASEVKPAVATAKATAAKQAAKVAAAKQTATQADEDAAATEQSEDAAAAEHPTDATVKGGKADATDEDGNPSDSTDDAGATKAEATEVPVIAAEQAVSVKVKDKPPAAAKKADAPVDPTKPTAAQVTTVAAHAAPARAQATATKAKSKTDPDATVQSATDEDSDESADAATAGVATSPSPGSTAKPSAGFGSAKVKGPVARQGGQDADPNTAAAAAVTQAPPVDGGTTDDATPADDAAAPVAAAATPVATTTPITASLGLAPTSPTATRRAAAIASDGTGSTGSSAADDASFAEDNHSNIAASVHGQLMPDGGTMQIRLDPANLGTVQVTVRVKDGSVSASFETDNDDATRLLSHSLGQLKSALEQTGISVDHMHVAQAPRSGNGGDTAGTGKDGQGSNGNGQAAGSAEDQQRARQEQQRREVLQKMWQRLSGGTDPIDLVA
jgi:flagellar hook-length control protein FliK